MFTQHQVDLFAETLHISEAAARRRLDARMAIEVEQDHTAALAEHYARQIDELKAMPRVTVDQEQLDYAHGKALAEQAGRVL